MLCTYILAVAVPQFYGTCKIVNVKVTRYLKTLPASQVVLLTRGMPGYLSDDIQTCWAPQPFAVLLQHTRHLLGSNGCNLGLWIQWIDSHWTNWFFFHHPQKNESDHAGWFQHRETSKLSSILPSGYVKIAIENRHRNSGFTQLENGGSFHSYVSLPEGNGRFPKKNHPAVGVPPWRKSPRDPCEDGHFGAMAHHTRCMPRIDAGKNWPKPVIFRQFQRVCETNDY